MWPTTPQEFLLPQRNNNTQKTNTLPYLWPFGIQESCLDGIIQGLVILVDFHVGCRTVAVEDAVLGVHPQGLVVEHDGRVEVALMASLVALPNLLHKFSFAQHGTVRTFSSEGFWSTEGNLGERKGRNYMLVLRNATQKGKKKEIKLLETVQQKLKPAGSLQNKWWIQNQVLKKVNCLSIESLFEGTGVPERILQNVSFPMNYVF